MCLFWIQSDTTMNRTDQWILLEVVTNAHSSTCFALWNQYEDEYSNYKITKCKILSINSVFLFPPPPASWSGPSCLLHDPLQQAPPWFSCSHFYLSLFPTFSQSDPGQITSLFCSEPSISLRVKVKVLTPRPHTICLLTSLSSSLPTLPCSLCLKHIPQCFCNSPYLSCLRAFAHAILFAWNSLPPDRSMPHSLPLAFCSKVTGCIPWPPCKKCHRSSQHQSPKHLFLQSTYGLLPFSVFLLTCLVSVSLIGRWAPEFLCLVPCCIPSA